MKANAEEEVFICRTMQIFTYSSSWAFIFLLASTIKVSQQNILDVWKYYQVYNSPLLWVFLCFKMRLKTIQAITPVPAAWGCSMRMRLLGSWTSHSGWSHLALVSTAAVTGVGWMKPYRGPPFAKLLLCNCQGHSRLWDCSGWLQPWGKLKLHSGAGNESGTSTMGRYKKGLILWSQNSLQWMGAILGPREKAVLQRFSVSAEEEVVTPIILSSLI